MWAVATIFAAAFQVIRNSFQRSLVAEAGVCGATLVRFLFGLPFSLLLVVGVYVIAPPPVLHFSAYFWAVVIVGSIAQILATVALLVAMEKAGFAAATAVQQSSVPMTALLGFVIFSERLAPSIWLGIAITSAGLAMLSWPRHSTGLRPMSGAIYGFASGLAFALAMNAFRQAGLELSPGRAVPAAVISLAIVQSIQAVAIGLPLLIVDRRSFAVAVGGWRPSLSAGLFGSLASAGWFVALAITPAGPVRAVGVVEVLFAMLAGRHIFKERTGGLQYLGYVLLTVGVFLCAIKQDIDLR